MYVVTVGSKAQECASEFFREGKLDRENLVKFVKEVKKYPGLTDEDAAVLAAAKYVSFIFNIFSTDVHITNIFQGCHGKI